ncbi:MAG: SEL1-like repeat protein [Alphaproteobacteria bacterium]|nr:SEL1-like repeat protein [Alphaproteobacteria bacterium]
MTRNKALKIFALSALVVYGGGVIFSHLEYSSDDRAACHNAGGFLGRIWCPSSVDTAGFRVHFVRALGWPVEAVVAPGKRAQQIEFAALKAQREKEAKALVELRRSAESGDVDAQVKLATLYQQGFGGSPDYAEAARWFQAAADRGEPDAQNSLSFAFEKGLGVGQNFVEAYKWASLAAAQDGTKTLTDRDTLLAKLSATEIDEAERRIREWQPQGQAEFLRAREEAARAVTKEVQTLLNVLGFDVGEPDGNAGPKTRTAISAFQLQVGIPTDSLVTDELIARLKSSVAAKQAQSAGSQ